MDRFIAVLAFLSILVDLVYFVTLVLVTVRFVVGAPISGVTIWTILIVGGWATLLRARMYAWRLNRCDGPEQLSYKLTVEGTEKFDA